MHPRIIGQRESIEITTRKRSPIGPNHPRCRHHRCLHRSENGMKPRVPPMQKADASGTPIQSLVSWGAASKTEGPFSLSIAYVAAVSCGRIAQYEAISRSRKRVERYHNSQRAPKLPVPLEKGLTLMRTRPFGSQNYLGSGRINNPHKTSACVAVILLSIAAPLNFRRSTNAPKSSTANLA